MQNVIRSPIVLWAKNNKARLATSILDGHTFSIPYSETKGIKPDEMKAYLLTVNGISKVEIKPDRFVIKMARA